MLKRATLLIPTTYNDGTAVPKNEILEIIDDCFIAFSGWTNAGEVTGCYRMQTTKEQQVDRLIQLWIVVPEHELAAIRRMAGRIAARLHQEYVYFEISESAIEFVPPLNEEGNIQ
jgi:hypothetical protein